MVYTYLKPTSPNLYAFESAILESSIANTYMYLNWNEDDQNLQVNLYTELTLGQKDILDNIINNTISTPIISFNVDNFLFGLMEAFTPLTDYANILVFYPMIADFARAKNFEGMKIFVQGLMSYSIMTQNQFNNLNNVLQLQGIDLNNL